MDKNKIWQTVLENLKITLSSASFNTWFPQTFIVNIKEVDKDHQIAEIGCPNPFVRNTIENRYYGLIKDAIDQATGLKNDLVFVVKQGDKPHFAKASRGREPLFETPIEEKPAGFEAIEKAGLRQDFTFENFAVSSTNQMAHAAAIAVSKALGKAYNPLFLYGGVGVGKTHLMQAVAHEVLKKNPRLKVICCTGEEFTNEIVNAIRKKTTQEFKQKFRTTKLLMVDDIQFIAGKDRAQEEFFHTFNSVWRAGGQIILTSDRRPEEISKLEDRLRSRFEGGLTIDIQPPDFELRTAILLIKAQQRKFNLPMDIAQLIASNITSTRKLEGFLTRIMTEAITRKEPLTVELVSAIIGKSNGAVISQRLVKPKEVISAVANHFEIKIADLTGERRQKIIVVPRQVLMYLLRTELKIQLVEIGRLLGGRDHSTIIHGVEKITHSLPTSEQLRVDIAGIKQRLYGPI
jgi:chromosomal replication initiator protein